MTGEKRTKVIDVELTISKLRELHSIYTGYFDGRSEFAELVGGAADLIEWYRHAYDMTDKVEIWWKY